MNDPLEPLPKTPKAEAMFTVWCTRCGSVMAACDPAACDAAYLGEAVKRAAATGNHIGFVEGQVSIHLGGCKCSSPTTEGER